MANKSTVIRITHAKNDATAWGINRASGEPRQECVNLAALLERIASGQELASVEVGVAGTALARASATATCASVVATDTILVNGVTFTAVANAATPTAAQFRIGAAGAGQDAECAANIAAALNASATAKVKNYITASVSGAVVTISAKQPGLAGNMFTLTSVGGTITVTGAGFLAGGTGDDATPSTYSRT